MGVVTIRDAKSFAPRADENAHQNHLKQRMIVSEVHRSSVL